MAYRKSTLRSMSPTTRKVARLIGEQESIARRFKNLVPEIRRLELDSQALANAKQAPVKAILRKVQEEMQKHADENALNNTELPLTYRNGYDTCLANLNVTCMDLISELERL